MLRLTNDRALVDALKTDWRTAELSLADHTMLAYTEKLTIHPWEMVEQDVVNLREVDFSDAAILDIAQVVAYYAFANRLVDGLGVELESSLVSADESP